MRELVTARVAHFLAAMTACATLAAASPAHAQESPAPRTTRGLPFIVTGAVTFGATWAASYAAFVGAEIGQLKQCNDATAAAQGHRGFDALSYDINEAVACTEKPAEHYLWVPAAGPWITLSRGQFTGAQRAVLVADGIAQGAGLALLAYGVYLQATSRAQVETPRSSAFRLHPGAGPSIAGLTLSASF